MQVGRGHRQHSGAFGDLNGRGIALADHVRARHAQAPMQRLDLHARGAVTEPNRQHLLVHPRGARERQDTRRRSRPRARDGSQAVGRPLGAAVGRRALDPLNAEQGCDFLDGHDAARGAGDRCTLRLELLLLGELADQARGRVERMNRAVLHIVEPRRPDLVGGAVRPVDEEVGAEGGRPDLRRYIQEGYFAVNGRGALPVNNKRALTR